MKKLAVMIGLCITLWGGASAYAAQYSITFPESTGYIFDRDEAGFTVQTDADGVQVLTVRCTADSETVIDEAFNIDGEKFFPLSTLDYGIHTLTVEVVEGTTVKQTLSQDITVINEHQPQLYDALSRVGVVQHRGQNSVKDTERLELMNKAGVVWARDLLSWWSYETSENVWDDSYGDKVCKAYSENGTKLHLTLCHYNDLYNAEDEKGYAPYTEEQLAKFSEYVRRIVTNYPDTKEFEIYNEPNRDATWKPDADVVAYCNLVKVASRVIRELRPDTRIVVGAVSNTRNTERSGTKGPSKGDGIRFLREMAKQGIFSYVDAISAHPYTYTNYSDSRYKDFLELYSNVSGEDGWYGWKDFQITETGFPTMTEYGIDEEVAAHNIIKSFVYGDSVGAEKVFIYEFVASGTDSSNREHQFGILNYDRTARLAYPALVQYCNMISGADYIGEVKLGEVTAYLYQKEGEITALCWAAADTQATVSQDTAVECFDIYGNPLTAVNNTITVGVSPVYVTGIDKAYAVSAAEDVLALLYSEMNEIAGTSLSVPELTDSDIAKAVNDNYSLAISCTKELDIKNKMLFADKVHKAGEVIAALYPLFDTNAADITLSDEMISSVRAVIEEKADGAELPFADAVLRRAERYYSFAKELDSFEENSTAKNSAVYAKYLIAENLCKVATEYASLESLDHQNSLYFSVTPTKVKSGGEYTVSGNITNASKADISKDFAVYDNENNRVSEIKTLNIKSGEKAELALDFTVSDTLSGGHYFYELRAENGGETVSKQMILIDIESMGPIDAVSPETINEYSDEKYIFSLDGKKFLLLDDSGKGTSKYFVMALDSYGKAAFSTDGTQRFNPENRNSIASVVNGLALPEKITDYIDENHIWRTEAGYLGSDIPNDYDTVCGVSILSHTEMMKYSARIGWNDLGQSWWLRTARGANSWWDKGLIVNWDKGRIAEHTITSLAAVRPVFWVDESFFDSVKLDSIGTGIAEYMNCGQLMANGIYTAAELEALGVSSEVFEDISIKNNTVSYSLKQGVDATVYAAVYDGNTLCSVEILWENSSKTIVVGEGQSMKLIVTDADGITPLCMPITN
ncbi:MAG: cellulase family glycosylhydrolase [Clostridia bacterium]|nr:cellulase family glycosylhydrolase [Clostridia bacterium]